MAPPGALGVVPALPHHLVVRTPPGLHTGGHQEGPYQLFPKQRQAPFGDDVQAHLVGRQPPLPAGIIQQQAELLMQPAPLRRAVLPYTCRHGQSPSHSGSGLWTHHSPAAGGYHGGFPGGNPATGSSTDGERCRDVPHTVTRRRGTSRSRRRARKAPPGLHGPRETPAGSPRTDGVG